MGSGSSIRPLKAYDKGLMGDRVHPTCKYLIARNKMSPYSGEQASEHRRTGCEPDQR